MVNLPNKITLTRIALIPVFILFLMLPIKYREYIAASIFIIIALTDALDGYIARSRNQVTKLGQLIDPLADKLLVTAALVFLIGHGIERWMAFLIIAREISVMGIRAVAASKGVVIKASKFGKVKTVVQIIAVSAVILNFTYAWHLMLLAVILTLVTGASYFFGFRKLLRE